MKTQTLEERSAKTEGEATLLWLCHLAVTVSCQHFPTVCEPDKMTRSLTPVQATRRRRKRGKRKGENSEEV
ncbi:hypothetical protein E2C01_046466 [Portunus trituberculatus]|uniref:Uncharacterized protein n=1 Tax=Portunus trituberculatus TaxID=210409 RepID=A0A5B7G7U1_PORTR|nr:hypothetical protein [Portunus trituberculatus]